MRDDDDLKDAILRSRRNMHLINARILYIIYQFGDELADKEGYSVDGLEAIAAYLLRRDGTPPERTLLHKTELLGLSLTQELRDWTPPRSVEEAEALDPDDLEGETWRLLKITAERDYATECFGDTLAEREDLGGVSGEEALRLYLVNKHHWHPADVAALSFPAMRDALAVEMKGWTMTREQVAATRPK